MIQRVNTIRLLILAAVLAGVVELPTVSLMQAQGQARDEQRPAPASVPSILNREQAGAIMPSTVFFRGQSAPTQARNSAGIRFGNDRLVLAALVDTSGYSSGIAQKYQAYLITEIALRVGDKVLPPGAYGFGFLDGDRMIVMDLGGNQLLLTTTQRDAGLTRPTPLQILGDPASHDRFRLFLGRNYVLLTPA